MFLKVIYQKLLQASNQNNQKSNEIPEVKLKKIVRNVSPIVLPSPAVTQMGFKPNTNIFCSIRHNQYNTRILFYLYPIVRLLPCRTFFLKTTDTIGNCQRPVFSLGVSQHMHKITNL